MKRRVSRLFVMLHMACAVQTSTADNAPFWLSSSLLDQTNTNTLGLTTASGAETVTVYAPDGTGDAFSNGIVMTAFKGDLYCMWQSSKKDEDAEDTWVAYSRSTDNGKTWSKPMVLAETLSKGYRSSGGWLSTQDKLIAYLNTWPSDVSPRGGYTQYVESTDGINWSKPADVLMADGKRMDAIFEQDPHVLPDGRIVNAAHFQPGLLVCPIYTDDPYGVSGWKKGAFKHKGSGEQSRELEPSLYRKSSGELVMIFRDQNSTYKKMASVSNDRGETWSSSVLTEVPDARTKQSAGNLPDGTAYFACNPVNNKTRLPLALLLSEDGTTFDKGFLLRSSNEIQKLRYEGKAKRAGYHYPKSMTHDGFLYVAYATNKEDVEYTRIPLSVISTGIDAPVSDGCQTTIRVSGSSIQICSAAAIETAEIFAANGTCVYSTRNAGTHTNADVRPGLYIVRVTTAEGTTAKTIAVR